MMKKYESHIGLTIPKETYDMLKYIAKYYERSINGHIRSLINDDIRRFKNEIDNVDWSEIGNDQA